MTKGAAVKFI